MWFKVILMHSTNTIVWCQIEKPVSVYVFRLSLVFFSLSFSGNSRCFVPLQIMTDEMEQESTYTIYEHDRACPKNQIFVTNCEICYWVWKPESFFAVACEIQDWPLHKKAIKVWNVAIGRSVFYVFNGRFSEVQR